jgi:hypothetical protein
MHRVLRKSFLKYYVALVVAAIILLIVFYVTEIEFMLHLAAIPLEILLAAFVVDQVLNLQERQGRRRRLKGEAASVFHSQIEGVIEAGIRAAQPPDAPMPKLASMSTEELKGLRAAVGPAKYRSLAEMQAGIDQLVDAEQTWQSILAQAIEYDVDETYVNMMKMLSFVRYVKAFRESHPDESFAHFAQGNEKAMEKMRGVSELAVRRYLDLLVDFKEHDPDMLKELHADD